MNNEAGIRGIIVDDDEQIREILRRMLPMAGVEVCAELSSGEAAVEWMAENEAEVVVMDIHMPGIGGTEATRLILSSKPATLVFGFTGWGPDDAEALKGAGARAVFDKTQFPQLLAAIRDNF